MKFAILVALLVFAQNASADHPSQLFLQPGEAAEIMPYQRTLVNCGQGSLPSPNPDRPSCFIKRQSNAFYVYSGNSYMSSSNELDAALESVMKLQQAGICGVQTASLPVCTVNRQSNAFYVYVGNDYITSTSTLDPALETITKLRRAYLCK